MSTHLLDQDRLEAHLRKAIPGFGGIRSLERFSGGQSNPTFRLETDDGVYVLRRQPPGKLLRSAHAVDREFRVIKALYDTPVPVPRVFHLCEDRDVIGSMFYLMDFCNGRIFWDAALPGVPRKDRRRIYDEVVRVLVELHTVEIDAVGLADFGRAGSYFERQLSRWTTQYRDSELAEIDAMERLMSRLRDNLPADDGLVSLVHGDFRLDNIVFDHNKPKAIAVLDWELSTLGHPFADLGYLCMMLRMPQGVGNMSGLRGKNLDALGIPSERELVTRYFELSGKEVVPHFNLYIAFSFFRVAAIIQGVAKRAVDGNASNKNAADVGRYVGPMAEYALEAIEEMNKESS